MRLGILGGTFDPIHHAHLLIAEEARTRFDLARVVIVPNSVPPHKARQVAPAEHRLAMARLAAAANASFAVSRLELDRPGRSYTVDTLRSLQAENPAAELWFIAGTDALAEIGTWHRPEEVARRCVLVAVEREGWPIARLRDALPACVAEVARIEAMPAIPLAISSTDLRRRVREGLPIRYLTPDAVAQYIADHGLYRS